MAVPSVLIAAPSSGSGKTTLTLALLRAYRKRGLPVSSFKIGPDYIDPAFHALATGRDCFNLDLWAMSPGTLARNAERAANNSKLVIGEAVMGLFDGAQSGDGSSADLAEMLQIPIILVVNAKGQAASAGALLHGFNSYRPGIKIAGVIFNAVGSSNHRHMLDAAAQKAQIPVLGYVPRSPELALDHRHLGLVQAQENMDIEAFLNSAADIIEKTVDLEKIRSIAAPFQNNITAQTLPPPPGQRISIARDDAFSFSYPHKLEDWREAGAELTFFSPLKDEGPGKDADFIYLPGGYPELHAERLSNALKFKTALRTAAADGTSIYGECGGFMTLGKTLTDGGGTSHEMLDLLPLATSFANPKLHLGYRSAVLQHDCFLGNKGQTFRAHEFHYASVINSDTNRSLFSLSNAKEQDMGEAGILSANVAGSFIHLIDKARVG